MALVLKPFDMSRLLSPSKVSLPLVESKPAFLTKEWLDATGSSILQWWESEDYRKPPTALVRCSRGGKTRALKELAHWLQQKRPGATILFVSFNDFSGLSDEEQLDPVGALCRRIAFAADSSLDKSGGLGAAFEKIGELAVSPKAIRDWLQQTPCVLLIDELNNMKELAKKNSVPGKDLAKFLKKNFLDMENRYLIFSSHVVTTAGDLSGYMETNSERKVQIVHLPIANE